MRIEGYKELYWHWMYCEQCKIGFSFRFGLEDVLISFVCPKCKHVSTRYFLKLADQEIPTIDEE